MNGYRLSTVAEAQLDDIWLYIAQESGNTDTAERVLRSITDHFFLLAQQPHIGRRRGDLAPDLRSFTVGNYVILYSIEEAAPVQIHYVFHGNRDIESLLRH